MSFRPQFVFGHIRMLLRTAQTGWRRIVWWLASFAGPLTLGFDAFLGNRMNTMNEQTATYGSWVGMSQSFIITLQTKCSSSKQQTKKINRISIPSSLNYSLCCTKFDVHFKVSIRVGEKLGWEQQTHRKRGEWKTETRRENREAPLDWQCALRLTHTKITFKRAQSRPLVWIGWKKKWQPTKWAEAGREPRM